MEGRIRHY